jgi:hypothetical protein
MNTPRVITLLFVCHCHADDGSQGSLWLIPGGMADSEDGGAYAHLHVTDYVQARGVLLKVVKSSLEENLIVEDVKAKFTAQGYQVEYEVTADD